MKVFTKKIRSGQMSRYMAVAVLFAVLFAMFMLVPSADAALTAGGTYTITVQKLNSNGSLAATSATATDIADADGKIAFTLSNVPDNTSCNFLVVTVTDSGGTTARRSIAPCPNAGESLPMGVSGLTNAQTDALIAAVAAAGTDDPILATFGFAITRSSAITADELSFMATLCNQGINGTGGFLDSLGLTSSQLAAYRGYIVARLANTASGYSKLIKDSVDASTDAEKLNARGEAASKLLLVLVQAATDTGFSQDSVLAGFNAMGSVVKPLIDAASSSQLSAATKQMINSSIGGAIQKLKADKEIEKYSAALTTLGASGSDVTNYQTAANTLLTSMTAAFKVFEQVFTGSETNTTIAAAEAVLNTAMNTAFTQFMTDTAASNTRISTMILNMESALGLNPGDTGLGVSNFQFYTSSGSTVNWPLTMVILVDWVSTTVSNSGSLSYTRDTTAIPSNLQWLGSCSNPSYYSSSDCQSNGGTWTAARTNFVAQGVPASYASLFGIQQDIEIFEFTRWAAQSSAGQDMGAHETLEKAFTASVDGLAVNIGGTTDGSTAVSSTLKTAILTLLRSPQF